MTLRVIRRPAVRVKCGFSDTTLWREMQRGGFPKPIRLAPNAVGWIEAEVDAWLEARMAQRDADDARAKIAKRDAAQDDRAKIAAREATRVAARDGDR